MPTITMSASTRTVVCRYDVDHHGGGTGEHLLTGDPIPVGGVILDAVVRAEEVFVPALPVRGVRASDLPTLALVAGGQALSSPMLMNPNTWPTGRVKRLELTAAARAVPADGPVAAAVGGVGGFRAGALLLVLSVLELPPLAAG